MPNEVKLPTEDDIRRLPRWARVAFAARCARRVAPLFQQFWPKALPKHVRAVEHAVEIAEQATADADLDAADAEFARIEAQQKAAPPPPPDEAARAVAAAAANLRAAAEAAAADGVTFRLRVPVESPVG
ncbi:MAG TPA: hypothetical protein VH092_32305 [Urbifossiella sp.]|nr:hypothetical protein [Urbifossiella sp.]